MGSEIPVGGEDGEKEALKSIKDGGLLLL